jgi:hypothetical protein
MPHYHFLSGISGCLPVSNEVFETKTEAREYLKDIVNDLDQSGNKFEKINNDFYQCVKRFDFIGDYLEITECFESECMEELD